jgi:hypothetical protein
VQIVTFTFEERMFFDVQNDVQVARRATVKTTFSVAGESNAGTVFHAGWNFCVDCALAQYAAFTFALHAGVGNDTPGALARGASTRNAEESLLVADLASSIAGTAGDRSFPWRCARTFTFLTTLVSPHCDLSVGAEDCVFELHVDVFAQIRAALGAAATAIASGTTTKNLT